MSLRALLAASVVLASVLLSGCAADEAPKDANVTVIPQNHSGQPYTLRVRLADSEGKSVFDKNYTLSATAHSGPATDVTLPTGKYRATLDAVQTSGGTRSSHEELDATIGAKSWQLLAIIETDHRLVVDVKNR